MSESLSNIGQLDYPIDPLTVAHRDIAEQYSAYLSTTYEQNAIQRREEWGHHFDKMHTRYTEHMFAVMTATKLPFSEMNVGIIGPGNKPVGRDFGSTGVEVILPNVKRIICADFSSTVIANAIDDLRGQNTIEHNKIFPLMYDFTTGLSTGYHRFIQNNFADIQTFSDLSSVTERIDNIETSDFRKKIVECLADVDLDLMSRDSSFTGIASLVSGNRNDDRTLKLTTGGEPIEMHSWFLPMVIAGTGAASEGDVWQVFMDTIESQNNGKKVSAFEYDKRVNVLRHIHDMIAKYNTLAATEIIATVLHDNPNSSVLAVTDESTTHNEFKNEGALLRLLSESMRKRLKELGILMRTASQHWNWKDEPSHFHGVKSFTFQKVKTEERFAA